MSMDGNQANDKMPCIISGQSPHVEPRKSRLLAVGDKERKYTDDFKDTYSRQLPISFWPAYPGFRQKPLPRMFAL